MNQRLAMRAFVRARRLVAELDKVDSAARGQILKPGGHLRVDAPASFANCRLISALVDFHREDPDITIALWACGKARRPSRQ